MISAELALAHGDPSRYDHNLLTPSPRKDNMSKDIQTWKVKDLKPHPRQAELFADLPFHLLRDLAQDIADRGLKEPLEILPDGTIICGHQRARAAELLEWDEIAVWVNHDLAAQGPRAVEQQLIEDNLARRNLDRLDQIRCYRRLVEMATDSTSGVKGVRYNAETDTWSAYAYRAGRCHHLGTYGSKEQAQNGYEAEMRVENPDLHLAPKRVERTGIVGPDQGGNPDGLTERDAGKPVPAITSVADGEGRRLHGGKGSPSQPSVNDTLASMVRYSLSRIAEGSASLSA
jgi:hypothetical protein